MQGVAGNVSGNSYEPQLATVTGERYERYEAILYRFGATLAGHGYGQRDG